MPGDLPFERLSELGERYANQGMLVFFKFTCVVCGARQTFPQPNQLFTSGECEECGGVTDLTKTGGGFTLVATNAAGIFRDVMDAWAKEPSHFESREGRA